MKKKIILGIITLVVLVATSWVGLAWANGDFAKNKKPSDWNIGMTMEQAQQEDKPILLLFYADWCRYCQKFMPRYNVLSKLQGTKYNFVMINVDDEANKKMVRDFYVSGYPSVYVVDSKYDLKMSMPNQIYFNLSAFNKELDNYSRIHKLLMSKNGECAPQ